MKAVYESWNHQLASWTFTPGFITKLLEFPSLLPSGKRWQKTKWERSTSFFMGKFILFMVIFHSYVELPEGTSKILQFGSQELCVWLATASHICVDHTNVTITNKYVYPMNIGYDDVMGLYIRGMPPSYNQIYPFLFHTYIYIYICLVIPTQLYMQASRWKALSFSLWSSLCHLTVNMFSTHTHQILCFLKRCVLLVIVSSCVASLAATDPP